MRGEKNSAMGQGLGPRGAGLSLSRKLDEQRDCQGSQQIKEQKFVHFLAQDSLPALKKEEIGQKDLRTRAPGGPRVRVSTSQAYETLSILSLGVLVFKHSYPWESVPASRAPLSTQTKSLDPPSSIFPSGTQESQADPLPFSPEVLCNCSHRFCSP